MFWKTKFTDRVIESLLVITTYIFSKIKLPTTIPSIKLRKFISDGFNYHFIKPLPMELFFSDSYIYRKLLSVDNITNIVIGACFTD